MLRALDAQVAGMLKRVLIVWNVVSHEFATVTCAVIEGVIVFECVKRYDKATIASGNDRDKVAILSSAGHMFLLVC